MGVPHYLNSGETSQSDYTRSCSWSTTFLRLHLHEEKQLDLRAKNDDIRLFFALFFYYTKSKEEHEYHG